MAKQLTRTRTMPAMLMPLLDADPIDTSSMYWNEMRMPTCTCVAEGAVRLGLPDALSQ